MLPVVLCCIVFTGLYTLSAVLLCVVFFTGVLLGGKMFVHGGTGFPFSEVRNNVLYYCDLKSLHWNVVDVSGTLRPDRVYGHVCLFHILIKCYLIIFQYLCI